MNSEEEGHAGAPEPKRPATGDGENAPETSDIHLNEHEGSTKFFVVYNKKPIALFFNLVSSQLLKETKQTSCLCSLLFSRMCVVFVVCVVLFMKPQRNNRKLKLLEH